MANRPRDPSPASSEAALPGIGAFPRIVRPLQEFLSTETAGGALLLAAALGALIWANIPGDSYDDFWGRLLRIDLQFVDLDLSLAAWVNDGLMTVFFFVVGLEIKRELVRGELASPRRAALPVAAALGGMIVPAAIFLAFNLGGEGERGWGIPMATDVAFAVGVLTLLGNRAPTSLKVFLLALAIVDDIAAIVVIAIFYTNALAYDWLAFAVSMFALAYALGRAGANDVVAFAVIGLAAWLGLHESGVHATIVGVAFGLLAPLRPNVDARDLDRAAVHLVDEARRGDAAHTRLGDELRRSALRDLEELSREGQSILDRLEHRLHPWTSYAIIPLFALANAGIEIGGDAIGDAVRSRVTLGAALGLMVGKPLGIMLFSLAAVRLGLASMPEGVRRRHLAGASMVGGIGFTVSIFIAQLAFHDSARADEAKMGILAGSLIMGIAGYVLLRTMSRPSKTTAPPAYDSRPDAALRIGLQPSPRD